MAYCVSVDGQKIPDLAVREIILTADFETAYYTFCKFITKRTLKGLHKKIIRHKSRNKSTLDLAPRGFGKSTVGDVDYVLTKILRNPNIRIMVGSKIQTQAEAFLKEIRTHFEANEDLIRVFGEMRGRPWTDKEFTINTRSVISKESTCTALGASGAVVSKHFDIIVVDDLVGFENARSELQRTTVKEWFYSALLPTLEPDGEVHILGTRYHPSDLYQTLMESGNYSIQIQQAIQLKEGQEVSLWEDKFDLETLKKIRQESGSIIFGMQYQNDVELAKGDIFKAEYFKYYDSFHINPDTGEVTVWINEDGGTLKKRPVKVYMGVDLAISQKNSADYFVIFVIGMDANKNIFCLDYLRTRKTFDQQFNAIVDMARKYKAVERIGVESVAYQEAMVQELRRTTNLPVIGIPTGRDKVTRAYRRSALFENGKVYFRANMQEVESEFLLMSRDGDQEHDDIFDAFDHSVTVQEHNNMNVLDRSLFRI